jgi:diguanylate cyclase (GGDEF)-like protein
MGEHRVMTHEPQPTVLIVDDDRVNRTVLAQLLQGECRLILARDGASALTRLEEEDVSLVLLDVSMPDMDGYEVLRQIRANPRTRDISVIFITSQTDEADEERGLSLGASDYVTKPIRPAIVLARIRVHLKLAQQRRELMRLSTQDGLTGLANRRHFDETLQLACRQVARTGGKLGLALLDVDHFKQYNDLYGHGAGDDTLRRVAQVLGDHARRPSDLAARYGGEEFVLLTQDPEHFGQLLERIRLAVSALSIPHQRSSAGIVTISCGGVLVAGSVSLSPSPILTHADRLLYRAKHDGRNRIVFETIDNAAELSKSQHGG